jgi:hypothetical protein
MEFTHFFYDGVELVGVDRTGGFTPEGDWSEAQIAAALKFRPQGGTWDTDTVYVFESQGRDGSDDGADVESGDQSGDGDGQGESEGESEGESGQGEQGDESEGDGDGDGDGDGESEGESEGEADGEQEGEADPTFSQNMQNSLAGEPGSLEQDLWDVYYPLVVNISEDVGKQAFQAAVQVVRREVARAKRSGSMGGEKAGGVFIDKVRTGSLPEQRHFMFDTVLRAVARGVHVYLPGEPGTGKSHMASQIAEVLGRELRVSSFSPMSTESKLIGFRDANGGLVRTGFRDAYEHGHLWLGDELDNSNPAIVTGLNSGLANGFMEFPDGTIERHEGFVCIATANTLGTGPTAEFAGRQKLDPATLNRFVKFYIGTDEVMESALVENILGTVDADRWLSKLRLVRRAVADLRIKHFVTMRDALNGAKLCQKGDGAFTMNEALEATVLAVLNEDQRAKIAAWNG